MPNPLRDRPVAQTQLAEARAQISAGRALIMAALEEAWSRVLEGHKATRDHKIALQLAATHGTRAAAEAIDLIHAAVEQGDESRLRRPYLISARRRAIAGSLRRVGSFESAFSTSTWMLA